MHCGQGEEGAAADADAGAGQRPAAVGGAHMAVGQHHRQSPHAGRGSEGPAQGWWTSQPSQPSQPSEVSLVLEREEDAAAEAAGVAARRRGAGALAARWAGVGVGAGAVRASRRPSLGLRRRRGRGRAMHAHDMAAGSDEVPPRLPACQLAAWCGGR